nr:hypothetical protein ISGA_10500 [Gordonia sp. NB41Y]
MMGSLRTEFAERFERLYRAAGSPPARIVCARANEELARSGLRWSVSPQRVSDWRRCRTTPARFEVFAPVLNILVLAARGRIGTTDEQLLDVQAWEALWQEIQRDEPRAGSVRTSTTVQVCPYRGLGVMTEADHGAYGGRTQERDELSRRVAEMAGTGRLIVLTGATGSGKSSFIRAGFGGTIAGRPMVGGIADPRRTMTGSPSRPAVVVVDQFERLLVDPRAAEASAAWLAECARRPGVAAVVVLRSDRIGCAGSIARLQDGLAHNRIDLAQPSVSDVMEAITAPARHAGLAIGDGLEQLIRADLGLRPGLGLQAAAAPLPVLSWALQHAWLNRERNTLTVSGYERSGGITGAIVHLAEQCWAGMSESDRGLCRDLLLRLVVPRSDGVVVGGGVPVSDLVATAGDPGAVRAVLSRLVDSRVLIADADGVRASHDALFSEWGRMRDWLAACHVGVEVPRAGPVAPVRLSAAMVS